MTTLKLKVETGQDFLAFYALKRDPLTNQGCTVLCAGRI